MNYDKTLVRQAEMAVIGAIILDESSMPKVIDTICLNDFYFTELREIYSQILRLSSLGKSIDFITVLNALSAEARFSKNEIKELLLLCCETTPSVKNIEHYADIVHKSALARKIEKSLLNAISEGITNDNVTEESEKLINNLSEIMLPMKNKRLQPLNELSQNLIDYYSGKIQKIENRCDTGYPKIDKILKGMSGGNLIILASRPKVGKTAFAMSIALNVAKTGKKVAFYSQEMLGEELCERILSKQSGISMDKLINKDLTPHEIENLKTSIKNIQNNLIINDSAGISPQSIRLNCRMIKNLGLIIIDYLQLMKIPNGKNENRNQEIGSISRELKVLAMDLNVPILCLSQLNRNSNENQHPSALDLRDSGSIEQDANKVVLMWCVKKHDNFKTIGVDVALNRRGSTGVTLLNFNGEKMQFTELEGRYQEDSEPSFDWRNKIYRKSF